MLVGGGDGTVGMLVVLQYHVIPYHCMYVHGDIDREHDHVLIYM